MWVCVGVWMGGWVCGGVGVGGCYVLYREIYKECS